MGDTELLRGLAHRMSYLVKSIFDTIQGEGYYAGTSATFIRLAGCNLWSGHKQDRQRDHERNKAECPKWCDTDFVGGERLTARQIVRRVSGVHMVITGGEPLLQLNMDFLDACQGNQLVQIESNGTIAPQWGNIETAPTVYLTISPKTAPDGIDPLAKQLCSEVKVVYPSYDPKLYEDLATRRYIQPLADGEDLNPEHMLAAAEFVMINPGWKLSVQTHKVVGLD